QDAVEVVVNQGNYLDVQILVLLALLQWIDHVAVAQVDGVVNEMKGTDFTERILPQQDHAVVGLVEAQSFQRAPVELGLDVTVEDDLLNEALQSLVLTLRVKRDLDGDAGL